MEGKLDIRIADIHKWKTQQSDMHHSVYYSKKASTMCIIRGVTHHSNKSKTSAHKGSTLYIKKTGTVLFFCGVRAGIPDLIVTVLESSKVTLFAGSILYGIIGALLIE